MRAKWGLVSVAALAVASGAVATIGHADPDGATPDALLVQLRRGSVIEQYLAQLVGSVRLADVQGDGLDKGDIALAADQRRAQARASSIGQILVYDLDGDFKVSRAEVQRAMRGEGDYREAQVARLFERLDTDSDGVITLSEAAAGTRDYDADTNLEALLALDPNKDGKLTAEEMRKLAERAFNAVDRDRDGRISDEEYAAIADKVTDIQRERSAPRCSLPALPAAAKLVALGVYESDAISSAVIGGQDQETNFIDVAIEPGATPLYLVLSSYESMVWRLSGATGRIAQLVVTSQHTPKAAGYVTPPPPMVFSVKPGAARSAAPPRAPAIRAMPRSTVSASGVIGVPRDKVTIAESNCPPYFYKTDGSGKTALATIKRSLGRAPDAVFTSYSARRVSLPSGTLTRSTRDEAPVPAGFDATVWRDAVRYWPGGLVAVDPRQVVATTTVAPYQVLPSQMGLAQLVGSGALQQIFGSEFRIVRPIAHMPPSMGGAHSVTLVVAKGVPVPPGDPVHSCIVREDSGQSTGAACRMRR